MILDLFAGPGGWSEGLKTLGLSDVGIEWDAAACATRRAAGHLTIRADVSQYPTEVFVGKVTGLIASPPCTAFSTAGKGAGMDVIADLIDAIGNQEWGAMRCCEPTVWLPLEVGRWVDALRPEWVACEQVPPALPLWESYLPWLRSLGYSAWCGVLNAADYGVPQTRQRAFLMATRVSVAHPPVPTHDRSPMPDLFGGELKPWVSMAEALGWGMTAKPYLTVAPGHNDAMCLGGKAARSAVERERESTGRWRERERAQVVGFRRSRGQGMTERHGERPDTPVDEPAPVVTSKWRSDEWIVLDRRQTGAPPSTPDQSRARP